MGLFDDDVEGMLEAVGDECEAIIGGKCVHFYGTFDADNSIEGTDGVRYISPGYKLTVATSIARRMSPWQIIKIDDVQYKVNQKLRVDDGALTELTITEVTT